MPILRSIRRAEPDLLFAALLAVTLVGLAFALQGNVGIALRDEGFLWYGVVRTAHGEVPLLDFRSYDPGRYDWCAAWSKVFGEGILALRLSCAIFQVLGLACGILAARRAVESRWMLVPIGALLLLWMYPPWKLFEPSLAMAAVYVGVLLLERPSPARHAVMGAFVGLSAFMGRNLGLYTGLAFAGLILLAQLRIQRSGLARKLSCWVIGVVLGYAPMIAMLVLVPGYRQAFVDSIRLYVSQGALNAPLPVPWPWNAHPGSLDAALFAWCLGICFLLLPAFYLAAGALLLLAKRESMSRLALLAASTFVGVFHAHHVSVRSDIPHLAQCIHPLWLGVLALPKALAWSRGRLATAALTAALLALGLGSVGQQSPYAQKLRPERPDLVHVPCDVAGDRIWIDRGHAQLLDRLRAFVATRVRADETIWFSSRILSLYPMLGRRSPVWDLYPAWKADERMERRMLREMEAVDWAIQVDEPVGNEGLRLSITYPQVWSLLTDRFEPVAVEGLPGTFHVLRRRRG
jgi:hypothetical protein